jgi:hypothetical protein
MQNKTAFYKKSTMERLTAVYIKLCNSDYQWESLYTCILCILFVIKHFLHMLVITLESCLQDKALKDQRFISYPTFASS